MRIEPLCPPVLCAALPLPTPTALFLCLLCVPRQVSYFFVCLFSSFFQQRCCCAATPLTSSRRRIHITHHIHTIITQQTCHSQANTDGKGARASVATVYSELTAEPAACVPSMLSPQGELRKRANARRESVCMIQQRRCRRSSVIEPDPRSHTKASCPPDWLRNVVSLFYPSQ
jgi:hypothetical protein